MSGSHLNPRFPSADDSQEKLGSSDNLTLLLEELRQLRQQLVQTIENNNGLRQKLEEQLRLGPARAAHHHYYMNPHDGTAQAGMCNTA